VQRRKAKTGNRNRTPLAVTAGSGNTSFRLGERRKRGRYHKEEPRSGEPEISNLEKKKKSELPPQKDPEGLVGRGSQKDKIAGPFSSMTLEKMHLARRLRPPKKKKRPAPRQSHHQAFLVLSGGPPPRSQKKRKIIAGEREKKEKGECARTGTEENRMNGSIPSRRGWLCAGRILPTQRERGGGGRKPPGKRRGQTGFSVPPSRKVHGDLSEKQRVGTIFDLSKALTITNPSLHSPGEKSPSLHWKGNDAEPSNAAGGHPSSPR